MKIATSGTHCCGKASLIEELSRELGNLRGRRASISSYSAGTLRHEPMLRSIELDGREVIPRVRQLLTETSAVTVGGGVVGLEA